MTPQSKFKMTTSARLPVTSGIYLCTMYFFCQTYHANVVWLHFIYPFSIIKEQFFFCHDSRSPLTKKKISNPLLSQNYDNLERIKRPFNSGGFAVWSLQISHLIIVFFFFNTLSDVRFIVLHVAFSLQSTALLWWRILSFLTVMGW